MDPRRLGKPVARGAHLLESGASGARSHSRWRRLVTFVKKPWVWGVAVFTAVSTLVAFLNLSLDLLDRFDRTEGDDRPPLDGKLSDERPSGHPDELIGWNESLALCGRTDGPQPRQPLVRAPTEGDTVEPGDEELGTGVSVSYSDPVRSWALAEPYDVPLEELDERDFVAAGAVVLGGGDVEMVLFNRREGDVVVTNITAEIERRPPFDGTLIQTAGGDSQAIILLILDLAEDEPTAMTLDDRCEPYPFFARYKLVVGAGKVEIVTVRTYAAACDCRYRLRLEYWYDGTRHTATIPAEDEKPLASMGLSDSGYDLIYTVGINPAKVDCRQDPAACGDTYRSRSGPGD